ncbi:clustered with transcription termination protein NusA [Aequoribacter fuscus]|jgi:ribosome maturation factor RimP|uniref:Ribosome maturation factor RimP n=1 Tax=Aequoribacter fuscus TaxID=2518989 RepID=F3L343_9GAMM|nr:ribosome maturation factor RimP [Aequoribacter fuscus]EGG29283.1 clustered with transcription termination protein NusA [Aequoribacter fuscus]QHJ87321.1 ribosome maturation factor RimP [Aequoribacter fuscus]
MGGRVTKKEAELADLLRATVEAMGFALWGLEFRAQGKNSLLRVYIDREAGVQVDDCAQVSRQISGILDVEDPIAGEYNLEVSSPGIDRLLFSLEQCQQYVGEWLEVKLRVPFEGRKNFNGTLVGIEDQDVVVRIDDDEYVLPFDSIDKAKVKPRL